MRKTIESLTAADFAKWVRKQVRQFGRKAEICNQQYSAVEMWLRELGFVVSFICGGEVEVDGEWYVSDFNRDPVAFVRSAQAAKHPRVEVRYSCHCCGRDTKRPVGLCGRCLL